MAQLSTSYNTDQERGEYIVSSFSFYEITILSTEWIITTPSYYENQNYNLHLANFDIRLSVWDFLLYSEILHFVILISNAFLNFHL